MSFDWFSRNSEPTPECNRLSRLGSGPEARFPARKHYWVTSGPWSPYDNHESPPIGKPLECEAMDPGATTTKPDCAQVEGPSSLHNPRPGQGNKLPQQSTLIAKVCGSSIDFLFWIPAWILYGTPDESHMDLISYPK